MGWTALICALGLAASPQVDPAPRGLAEALRALDGERWEARAAAEGWLARHLAGADFDALRAALAPGSAECRQRAQSALVEARAGVELAVRLAVDADPELARLGRSALRERLVRWAPGWDRPPSDAAAVRLQLADLSKELFALAPGARDASWPGELELLARAVPDAPPIVRASVLGAWPEAPAREVPGTFAQRLHAFVRARNLTLVGYDLDEELGALQRPWVLVTRDETTRATAIEFVLGWLCDLEREPLVARRRQAARALAQLGWPDALAWIDARWRASRARGAPELAWLDGLCAAAGRGAVSSALAEPAEYAWCLQYLDDAALEPRPELRRERVVALASALARVGRLGAQGVDLAPSVTWPAGRSADPLALWARLVIWEGQAHLEPPVLVELDRALAQWGAGEDPAHVELLLQGLRTRRAAVPGSAAPRLERPAQLFSWAQRERRGAELLELLIASRAGSPEAWLTSGEARARDPLFLAALPWVLADERLGRDALADVLRDLPDEELLDLARTAHRYPGLGERLAAAQLAQPRLLLFAALLAARPDSLAPALAAAHPRLHACALGTAAASGDPGARAELLQALVDPARAAAAREGLDWAIERLRLRLDHEGERALVQAVRAAAGQVPRELRASLAPERWPVRPETEAVELTSGLRSPPAERR